MHFANICNRNIQQNLYFKNNDAENAEKNIKNAHDSHVIELIFNKH